MSCGVIPVRVYSLAWDSPRFFRSSFSRIKMNSPLIRRLKRDIVSIKITYTAY